VNRGEYFMNDKTPPSSRTVVACVPVVVVAVVAVMDVVAAAEGGTPPAGVARTGVRRVDRRVAPYGCVRAGGCGAVRGAGLYDGHFEERRGYTATASVAGVTGVAVTASVTLLAPGG
jgi:hypothetical protein